MHDASVWLTTAELPCRMFARGICRTCAAAHLVVCKARFMGIIEPVQQGRNEPQQLKAAVTGSQTLL
jgi:hypothetical protein